MRVHTRRSPEAESASLSASPPVSPHTRSSSCPSAAVSFVHSPIESRSPFQQPPVVPSDIIGQSDQKETATAACVQSALSQSKHIIAIRKLALAFGRPGIGVDLARPPEKAHQLSPLSARKSPRNPQASPSRHACLCTSQNASGDTRCATVEGLLPRVADQRK